MSNFTIDIKKYRLQSLLSMPLNAVGNVLSVVASYALIALLLTSAAAQQHSDNNKDQTLRGSGRVNPSTLGLEIEIPLGNFPGRGIDIPVSMSYSSKVWRTEFVDSQPRSNNPGSCIQINTLEYADRSAAGWTSSLVVPYIEYTGADNLFDENGHALSMNCAEHGSGSPPELDAAYVKRITVYLPSGESHELRKDDSVVTYPQNTPVPVIDFNGSFYAADGSNIRYIEDAAGGTYKLLMPDGSFYLFSHSKEQLSGNNAQLVRKAYRFEDRNGNYTTYDSASGSLTDTNGRLLPTPVGLEAPDAATTASNPQIYNLPGFNGSTLTYKFHWKNLNGGSQPESALTDISDPRYQIKYKADRASANPQHAPRTNEGFLFESQWDSWVHDSGDPLFNPVVLTGIELPNGARYSFSYDIYGRIERIRYPTGGEERIVYQEVPGLTATPPDDISNQTNFGVSSRKVFSDSQNPVPYEWTYSATHVAPAGYKVTVVSPENIKTERLLYRGNDPETGALHGRFGYDNALTGMSYEDRVYDKNNALIARTKTQWTKTELVIQNAPGVSQKAEWHPRLKQTEKIVYDTSTGVGIKAVKSFEYDRESELNDIAVPVLRNRTFEYGYENTGSASTAAQFGDLPDSFPEPTIPPPAAPLERSTQVTFLINDPAIPESIRAVYRNENLVALTTVSELMDATGSVYSRTESFYDQAGASGAIGRGNTTEVKKWDSTRGLSSDGDAYISARKTYDQYGNPVSTTDAMGNVSSKEYDSAHNTFPVRITGPAADPDGSNGSNSQFVQTSAYDASTGLLVNTTNANGLETRFEYDAQTLRLRRTSQFLEGIQVGGVTEIEFRDEAHSTWVKTRKQTGASAWDESISHFDGLGRGVRIERVHAGGNIFIDSEFDSEGRVSRVSGPFRNGETRRWTTNEYDDAGRVIKVTGPDGTSVTTDFGVLVSDRRGTTKTVTDQAGRSRTGVVDALGRMIRVIEDPQGEALETDYTFDVDNRIRETLQGDQHRYFNFDSLGRLLHSMQPEQDANPDLTATDRVTGNSSWAYRFEYDANGNTVKTTDPRNTSILADFDALNRPVKRTFSDSTPEVSFYYDGAGLPTAPSNAKGKLTRVSSQVSETRNTAFDESGRVTAYEQETGNETYHMQYEYDLSGRLAAETYPSERRMVYELNTDGELETVRGFKSGNTSSTVYLSEIERNAAGSVTGLRLGNGRWGLAEYNDREQITRNGLGYSQGDTGVLSLDFEYGGNANNGSLTSQKINYQGLPNEIAQTYSYDALNRIESSAESVSTVVNWRETFYYDRYGNREFDSANTTTLATSDKVTNPAIDFVSNRMERHQDGDAVIDYVYDQAGNLILDAENKRFVYDAENRITSFFKGTNTSNNPDGLYQYDGEGRRVRKQDSGSETVFVYNAFGKLIAEYSDKLPETPQIGYITKDHLGSTRVVTDGSGTVVSRNDFMAFGEDLTGKLGNISGRSATHGYGAASDIRNQYTGYERDGESGLDFAQARYYNAALARYTSVDPLTASANLRNPQTFNRYSYVLNSPHKFVDPLGLIAQSTGACGQDCENSNWGGWDDFGNSPENGSPLSWQIDKSYMDMARSSATSGSKPEATEPPEPPPADDPQIDFNWWTFNDKTERVDVSEAVDQVLDEAVSAMTENIMTAMSAVQNLEDHPQTSSSVAFTVGFSAGAGEGGGSLGLSVRVTATFDSAEAIQRAVKDANDKIQIETVNKLRDMETPVASSEKPVKLGEASSVSPYPNMASNFGSIVRRAANQAARDDYNTTFPKRAGLFERRAYPSQFDEDH